MQGIIVTDTKNNKSQQPAEEIRGTTVYLEIESPGRILEGTVVTVQISGGSGFFVARDKIATNFHVVEGAIEITAKRIDTDTVYTVEGIVAFNVLSDLAILKVTEEGIPFILGDNGGVQNGDRVSAIGYLGDKNNTVEGVVQKTRKRSRWTRIKAPLEPGWSGCPVLNSKGEVIGVHSRGNKLFRSIGYAVPSNTLKVLLEVAEDAKVQSLSVWQKRHNVRLHTEYKGLLGLFRVIWHAVKGTFQGIRASIKQASGDHEGAIAIYDKIIASRLIGSLKLAYALRGIAKSELGDFQDAMADAHEAILLDPESYNGYYSRGYVNRAFGKFKADRSEITEAQSLYQEAINDYTGAINLKPEKAEIYNNRGWAKYLLGQLETEQGNAAAQSLYQEAVWDTDEALRLQQKGAKFRSATYHTRGVAKVGLGDHSGAIEDFNESIRLNPKKALYYHDRGLAKGALGQHGEAKVDFAKATELDSDFENTLDTKHRQ
ncbi:hypothetical protein C6503_20310 [Candidatus Poribacteria bacterium]|nr:MAG: hypothetical protein C6503_20310 [Candidatus Poribacteria bacterium]